MIGLEEEEQLFRQCDANSRWQPKPTVVHLGEGEVHRFRGISLI